MDYSDGMQSQSFFKSSLPYISLSHVGDLRFAFLLASSTSGLIVACLLSDVHHLHVSRSLLCNLNSCSSSSHKNRDLARKKLFTIGKRRKQTCDKSNEGLAQSTLRSILYFEILKIVVGRDCESFCIDDRLYSSSSPSLLPKSFGQRNQFFPSINES